MQNTQSPTIAIRLGNSAITVCPLTGDAASLDIEMKGGMSASANLREALKQHPEISENHRHAIILADAPTMLVPEEDFSEDSMSLVYDHSFSGHENEVKKGAALPSLRAVAIFAIPRDVQTVCDDHFESTEYLPVCHPVWQHYGHQSSSVVRQHLYGYFHDGKVDVFAMSNQRMKFCNAFSATHPHDAVYYLLNAFSQSGMKAERDELVLMGATPQMQWIAENLCKYLKFVSPAFSIQPQAIPLDLALLKQSSNK